MNPRNERPAAGGHRLRVQIEAVLGGAAKILTRHWHRLKLDRRARDQREGGGL